MKNKTQIKLFLIIGIILIISSFFAGYNFKKESINDFPSQCYTNLQPPRYFSTQKVMPITTNDLQQKLTIHYIGDNLFTTQSAGTGSMRPTLSDGSILIMIKPEKEDIKVGDIVSVNRGRLDNNLLHRVIEIKEGKYITKGDSNNIRDSEEWTFNQINGKIVGILYAFLGII